MRRGCPSLQSVRLAPGVCAEVWVAVRGKGLDWATASASATLDTRVTCARAAQTATSERKAPTAASAPVQVLHIKTLKADFHPVSSHINLPPPSPCPPLTEQRATTRARSAPAQRTTNASTAKPAGCSTTTSVSVSVSSRCLQNSGQSLGQCVVRLTD